MIKYLLLLLISTSLSFCYSFEPPEGCSLSLEEWKACEEFIQKEAPHYFAKKKYFISQKKGLPCPIEKDPKNGAIYIHLQGKKGAYIGKGSRKIVTKSILFGPKPRIVARCEIDQSGSHEAEVLEIMKGLHGVLQSYSYIRRGHDSSVLIVEYFNSGALRDIVKGTLRIGQSELLPLFWDLLLGLKGIHERGYIHRDIKKENIFLTRDQGRLRAAIGDFGLALGMEKNPKKRIAIPNPNCSPEVLLFPYQQIDRREAETYSLGVLFYLMLRNKYPSWSNLIPQGKLYDASKREKRKRHEKIENLYGMEKERVEKLPPGFQKEISSFILEMLTPDPTQRLSLQKALERVQQLGKKWNSSSL